KLSGAGCYLKLKVQRRNFVPWMIVRIRKLRLPIQQLRLGRRTLIDARKEIDQMFAGRSRGRKVNQDIAMTVEAADIAHVGVVVSRNIDIVVLRPANTFEMDRDGRPDWPRRRSHADDACFDDKVSQPYGLVAIPQSESVQSA